LPKSSVCDAAYGRRRGAASSARARDQQARLFELNGARDLAQLSIEAGDATEALEQLHAIVDWFPATLDVPVLAEARALLR
jgi:hypothetical protein